MPDDTRQPLDDLRLDQSNLFREETFTDLRIGSIRQLTPITVDGARDLGRPMMFIGQTQLMSQMGPLPVQAPIEAQNLADAIAAFPEAIKIAIEAMVEEAKELQRQEMSRIVLPGAETTSKIVGPK